MTISHVIFYFKNKINKTIIHYCKIFLWPNPNISLEQ